MSSTTKQSGQENKISYKGAESNFSNNFEMNLLITWESRKRKRNFANNNFLQGAQNYTVSLNRKFCRNS